MNIVKSQFAATWMGVAVVALLLLTACEDETSFPDAPSARAPETPPEQTSRTASPKGSEMPAEHPPVGSQRTEAGSAEPSESTGPAGQTGPIRWKAPEAWREVEPSSRMRDAQFLVPAEDGEPATMTVFFFGAKGGGTVEQNIDRWVGQFEPDEGGAPKRDRRTINGLEVHTVDVTGTFDGGMAMGGGDPRPGQRMIAAIVVAPRGKVFFKLLGPEKTVTEHEQAFETLLSSLKLAE